MFYIIIYYNELGYKTIECNIFPSELAQVDENTLRKDFTSEELVEAMRFYEEKEREEARKRHIEAGKKYRGGKSKEKKLSENFRKAIKKDRGKVSDKIAAKIGWSCRTYEKAKKVV